ncbi:MAG: DUF2235 domain-containing protein [Pseudomonadota bacterium]
MPTKTIKSAYNRANPKPRHLTIFLDGTWNDESGRENDGVTTSIYRLFRACKGTLDESDVPHSITSDSQVALYFRGVGNDDDNGMIGSFFEGAFGAGEKRIRDNAYCHIVKHYRKGDTLSIFGFSRGAACARLLAASLKERGLFESLKYHYKTVENDNNGRSESCYTKYSDESKKKFPVDVSFLGIFDTVGAFGVPIDLGFSFQRVNLFKDMTIAANVKRVVHCVAIDETREPFTPTLCNEASHIDEVWFPGVHADIGGGYRHRELSAFPLAYMLDRLKEYFAEKPLPFEPKAIEKLVDVDPAGNINMHYHGDGIKMDPRKIYVQRDDKPTRKTPKIHRSAFQLMGNDTVYVAEPQHSFSRVQKVLYSPRGLGRFKESTAAVD